MTNEARSCYFVVRNIWNYWYWIYKMTVTHSLDLVTCLWNILNYPITWGSRGFSFIYLFLERGVGREKERERKQRCERETSIGCFWYVPDQYQTHNPGMCPDPGLNGDILLCRGHSTNWVTPIRDPEVLQLRALIHSKTRDGPGGCISFVSWEKSNYEEGVGMKTSIILNPGLALDRTTLRNTTYETRGSGNHMHIPLRRASLGQLEDNCFNWKWKHRTLLTSGPLKSMELRTCVENWEVCRRKIWFLFM